MLKRTVRHLPWCALLLLSMLISPATLALAAEDGPLPSITLMTVGPGEVYWSRFGHNGVIIDDGVHAARMISYGYFDFEQPRFIRRFLQGRMLYTTVNIDAAEDLEHYRREGRAVWLQPLLLPEQQTRRLAALLLESALPENADYRYDYFRDNCSTRVRDAIDEALDGALRRQLSARSRGYSYRMQALRLATPDLPMFLGIHLGLGVNSDRPLSAWNESFVPMELMRYLADARLDLGDGTPRPIVAEAQLWSPSTLPEPPEYPPNYFWWFALCGLLLAATLLLLAHTRQRSAAARWTFSVFSAVLWGGAGIIGCILALLWFATDHSIAAWNENLFQFNPLCLPLAAILLASARPSWRPSQATTWLITLCSASAALGAFLGVLPAFRQDNLDWIALALPAHLALWLAMGMGWFSRE